MDPKPLVSIIINNYNYGYYVADAIESALEQSYANIEVIVVDDGSTDDSAGIISPYKDRIQFLSKPNGGQASAMNLGFTASHGGFIIFLDADDLLLPGAVAEMVKHFVDEKVVKVHWPLWRIDEEGKRKGKTLPDDELAEGDLKEQVLSYGPANCGGPPNSPPTSGNGWARNFLNEVMPVPEDIFRGGVDNYLFVLCPLYGEIKSIQEPQGCYRVHGTNNTLRPDYMTTYFRRFEACCKALSDHASKFGILKDPAVWPRNHWFHKLDAALKQIEQTIPAAAPIVLVDDDAWNAGSVVAKRTRFYLSDYYGAYGGVPATDDEAIESLTEHQNNGALYIVFVWSSFWWLDYFSSFHQHLRANYTVVLENDLLIIFALSERKHKQ